MVSLLNYWDTVFPAAKTLVILMGLDIVSGWLVAIVKRRLNSSTSYTGFCKKTMILILVATTKVLEPYQGLPLSMMVATGFCAMEGLSILENAAMLGIPIPGFLRDVLEKMQSERAAKLDQKTSNKLLIAQVQTSEPGQPMPVEVVNTTTHPVPTHRVDS